MNILNKYANYCGVEAKRPEVPSSYYPNKGRPYIIIDNRTRTGQDIYEYYVDVLDMVREILTREGIDVYMFCTSEKTALQFTYPFYMLSPKQENYLIKNSLAVITNGNVSTYAASSYGVPSLGLYSSYPSELTKPNWDNKHIILESRREGNLPSYGREEKEKYINKIRPEEIANGILEMLEVKERVGVETIHVGGVYQMKVAEAIPDFQPDPSFFAGQVVNVRTDYHMDEQNLIQWIKGRKANLLINEPLNLDLINYYRGEIFQITASINDSFSEEWIKRVKNIGVKLEMFCEKDEDLEKFRFQYFDHTINKSMFKKKADLWLPGKLKKGTKFITGKILISEGERYSCLSAKKAGKVLTNVPEDVYDTDEFWKELDHFRLFNRI